MFIMYVFKNKILIAVDILEIIIAPITTRVYRLCLESKFVSINRTFIVAVSAARGLL